MDNVSVENSGSIGGAVYRHISSTTIRSTMKNCNVSHSNQSGVCVGDEGVMTIDGTATTIHHNCKDGKFRRTWGLHTRSCTSKIYLISPLKKEKISKNNRGKRNYGDLANVRNGTIKTIKRGPRSMARCRGGIILSKEFKF